MCLKICLEQQWGRAHYCFCSKKKKKKETESIRHEDTCAIQFFCAVDTVKVMVISVLRYDLQVYHSFESRVFITFYFLLSIRLFV